MLTRPFTTVVVANRGEAAVRFMRAARAWSREHAGPPLSIIAMYTNPDADAPFVRMASASINLGEPLVRGEDGKQKSAYLDVERIVTLAREHGADALWPGWGFASERPELQEACEAHGMVFLGPPASAMRALGDKIAAKRLAEEAGVPVSPWSRESVDEAGALECAARIGYPVLLKATAGGGGRGIRRVNSPEELVAAFRSAAAEAAAAFGDPSIFVEAFVAQARHVEVQVLADTHGGVWALGTRDCSMQRRQQKVLEEAPAPGLAPEVERALCEAGANLARASGYVSAGTAEFLLLPDLKTFYFLEMNTRLQVEHTVTEEIFGLDLVGLQIDIGRGGRLPEENPPPPRGAAIQARLNAEDPDQGFAPRAGRLVRFEAPLGPGVRVDSGYVEGDVVPTVFDSMLAKIIAYGSTRSRALARLETALRDLTVVLDSGLTNRSLLLELVSESVFREGPVTTRWLDQQVAERPSSGAARRHLDAALAAAALGDYLRLRRGHIANFIEEAQRVVPHTLPEPGPTKIRYVIGTQPVEIEVATVGPEELFMRCGEWEALVRAHSTGARTLLLEFDGKRHSAQRVATATEVYVEVDGVAHHFRRVSDGRVRAALPASVSQIHVQPGDRVTPGMRLLTLEAMKMETMVESPLGGTVRAVNVRPSSQVAAGEVMVEIDESGGEAQPVAGAEIKLPARQETGLDPLRLVEARLLGFDVTGDELTAALAALEHDPSPPRVRLLTLLRAAVVQEQLFKSGPFDDACNEANESTMDQLAWFAHHRRLDPKQLSERFMRRLGRFLALHGIPEVVEDDPRVAHALLRVVQARRSQEEASTLVLAVLHALARSKPGEAEATPSKIEQRVVFEKLANEAVQRGDLKVATAAWNLIYRWQDLPALQAEAARMAREAEQLWEQHAAAETPDQRGDIESALLALPMDALVRALANPRGRRGASSVTFLRMMLERIYEVTQVAVVPPVLGRHPCVQLRTPAGAQVAGVLVDETCDPATILAALPDDAEVDLLFGYVPAADALEAASRDRHPRWTALWVEDGEIRARTWQREGDAMAEQTSIRDLHPARPVAQELTRFSNFKLERLPAPAGLLLARAVAPGDDRLVAMAEVERFDPAIEGDFVRVPSFERVFLNAVQALREGSRVATGRPPAFNRVSLFVRPIVALSRGEWTALARRLGPATFDLSLHKVSVHGRFTLGDQQPPRELAVEWRDPTALGPRLEVVMPRERVIPVLSAYEQQVIAARRRRLSYPYEVVSWLTSREDIGRIERGRFEELELDTTGIALESVARAPGNNPTGVVVGVITNWSQRFPDGFSRVLLLGDPNKDMGSLGEGECRRIIAAIDYAEGMGVPVEWVALSGGARIAFDTGTENLDWTAAVLRRIVEFTARGGVINILVDGPCVGAQSYWNSEATMLMHCRGTLVMTPRGYMVLTGKRALEVSGSVAAETNQGIGGLEIMTSNGEAQYTAPDLKSAYELLLRHYEYTYVAPGERSARKHATGDPVTRDVTTFGYTGPGGFAKIGDLFSESTNPGRKKPFAIREVMTAVLDQDAPPLERWKGLAGGETTVVMHGQLGGHPVCMIGIESQPLPRRGQRPVDGPATWMSGTLFPQSSRKMARAIRAVSGVCPVVVLANLSGFDGSPESMRERQLEYGAEIGKAVVEFDGPILFYVIARYHGGAYVVFSRRLTDRLEAVALEGSYASVIGGGAAAAVVFTRLVGERVQKDPRVRDARAALASAKVAERRTLEEDYEAVLADVEAQVQTEVAREFDAVHNVARALEVGSLDALATANELRPALCARLDNLLKEQS